MALERADLDLLAAMPLFSGLSDVALLRIIGNSTPRPYVKGQVLFERGDEADHFYAVLDGWVKLCRRTSDGEEVVLGIFTRGETFAEAVMFMGERFPASAEVVGDSRLLTLRRDSVLARLRDDPDLAFGMLASTSRHLKLLVEQIEQIKGRPGIKRVGDFILKLCPVYEGSAVVGLPYEKALIAARLGMKPESFSRALARLRSVGVRAERDHITVADIRELANFLTDGEDEYEQTQP
ncbi:MAG: Crp/Fnr family transcriptional regulator [Hyphomicrobiales bacterium]